MIIKICVIFISLLIHNEGRAVTYYVDYDNGDNKNIGTRKDKPLKYYPGDLRAARNIKLTPGDQVLFKGGVKYKGTLDININGAYNLPIIFDGNTKGTFGAGKAIIDGSDEISDIYKCKHPVRDEIVFCVENMNIKRRDSLNIFSGNMSLYESNYIDIDDFHSQKNIDKYTTANANEIGSEYLKIKNDSFNKILSSWPSASLMIWGRGNRIYRRDIIKVDKETKKIYFKPVKFFKDNKYIIVNSASAMDKKGEYYYNNDNNIIYMIPYDNEFTTVSYAVREVGINISASNIIVRGFIIEKNGSVDAVGRVGIGIKIQGRNKLKPIRNIVIDGNILRNHKAIDKSGVITVLHGDNIQIVNNTIKASSPNRGVLVMSSNNIVTKNNIIKNISGTGIAYFGVNNSSIEENTISNIEGVHSNGISVYLGSTNNHIFNNCVANGLSAFTSNEAFETFVAANIFHSRENNYTVADWGGSNDLQFYNNVILNSYSKSLYISKKTSGVKIVNSVLDGLLVDTAEALVSHNVYTKLSWKQNKKYKWIPGKGDILSYMNSTSDRIKYSYPEKGVKIKLTSADNMEVTTIGYPGMLKNSCKSILNKLY